MSSYAPVALKTPVIVRFWRLKRATRPCCFCGLPRSFSRWNLLLCPRRASMPCNAHAMLMPRARPPRAHAMLYAMRWPRAEGGKVQSREGGEEGGEAGGEAAGVVGGRRGGDVRGGRERTAARDSIVCRSAGRRRCGSRCCCCRRCRLPPRRCCRCCWSCCCWRCWCCCWCCCSSCRCRCCWWWWW